MVQAHKGYFQEGKFVPFDAVTATIPNNVEVYIVITENAITETKTLAQKQNEALKEFFAGIKEIDDEPIDDEFLAIVNGGITIDSGVEL